MSDADKIIELAEKATPGPIRFSGRDGFVLAGDSQRVAQLFNKFDEDFDNVDANAAYIVAACNSAPALAKQAKALEELRETFGPMLRMIAEGATLHLTTQSRVGNCEVFRSGPVIEPAKAERLLKRLEDK